MPQWAGSCWYYLRFCDPQNESAPFKPELEKYWMPVDLYVGGTEHAVLHLLYARFWHKVLFDIGVVSTPEPFAKLVNQGLILGPDGEKMSKSRGNVINPDHIINEFGSDTLRLYEMFMGPLEKTKPWSTSGVKGVHSFLTRVFRFFSDSQLWVTDPAQQENPETLKLLHKTIKKVTEDIEGLRFNTAISSMMIFTNHCMKQNSIHLSSVKLMALILSPLAPHLGEELWELTGEKETLAYHPWPSFNADLVQDDLITMAVQINGKTRGTLEVSEDITQEELLRLAKLDSKLEKHLDESSVEIKKLIYVPKKIFNVITLKKEN